MTFGQFTQFLFELVRQWERVLDAHDLPAKIEALVVHVEHDGFGAGELDEFKRRQTDGAGADNETCLSRWGGRTIVGMAADGQRLHQRELIEAKFPRYVQLAGRHEE